MSSVCAEGDIEPAAMTSMQRREGAEEGVGFTNGNMLKKLQATKRGGWGMNEE